MVAVPARDVDGALRRVAPGIVAVLVYGPDDGLVAERARRAAHAAVDDPSDPFQLVRIDGDTVAAEPGRLADEIGTLGLFGGSRCVWVKPTGRNIAPAVEAAIEAAPPGARLVVEAGDLAKTSPLRTLCERSPRALAAPCYADRGGDLDALIRETLEPAGIRLSRDAQAFLAAHLGANRLASRGELEKLALYVGERREATLNDVRASLSDAAALGLDDVIDAAFAGKLAEADAAYRRALAQGIHPAPLLAGLLRHALALLPHQAEAERGRAPASVVEAWRGLFFTRKRAVEAQLALWSVAALTRLAADLQAAALAARRHPDLAEETAAQALWTVASRARRG